MPKRTRTPDEIVGDQVGTLEGKQICGALIFKPYNQINAILSNRY